MQYRLILSSHCVKQLKKLDKRTAGRILDWLDVNVDNSDNPKLHGKALSHDLKGLWRYRVGNYRVICKIENNELVVLAVKIAHRKEIYK